MIAATLPRTPSRVPGQLLLGGWPALAAVVIAGNDLWLKPRHPGLVSGKLSDLAINFLLPLVILAAWQWLGLAVERLGRSRLRLPPLSAWVAVAVSMSYFALLQLWPGFLAVHAAVLQILGAPFGLHPTPLHTPDPTDLFTLVTGPLALLYAQLRDRQLTHPVAVHST